MNKSVKSALAKLRNATCHQKKAGADNRTEYTSAPFLISSDRLLFCAKALSFRNRQVSWLIAFQPSFPRVLNS